MMEDALTDEKTEDQPAEQPDKDKKLPVALRDDKTKQFTDAGGAEKKG